MSPVDQLPVELTLNILLEAVPVEDRYQDRRVEDVASIHPLWRDIVMDVPQFWTYIRVRNPLDVVSNKLVRSRGQPLSIDFKCSDPDVERAEFLELVVKEMHRWKVFDFYHQNLDLIDNTFRKAAPILERISLSADPGCLDENDAHSIYIAGGPLLRHVQLRSVKLPFYNEVLSNLESLSITSIDHPDLLPSDLARVLQVCPGLRTLKLNDINKNGGEVRDDPPTTDIILPNLLNIHLEEVYVALSWYLLRYLEVNIGTLFHFSLEDVSMQGETEALFYAWASAHPGRSSTLEMLLSNQATSLVELALDENTVELKAISSNGEVQSFAYFEVQWSDVGLPSFWPESNTIPVKLKYHDTSEHTADSIQTLLQALATLDSMLLECSNDDAVAIMGFLSGPIDGEWLCPDLKEITLAKGLAMGVEEGNWGDLMNAVEGMVEMRGAQSDLSNVSIFDHEGNSVQNIPDFPFVAST